MALTFDNVCRLVQARVPLAPPLLVEDWVRTAHLEISGMRRWSHLRGEGQIRLAAGHSGTIAATHGNATLTGVGMTFVAGDAGRQIRTSGLPYTIISVNAPANTCVIDDSFGGATSAAVTAYVGDYYATMPEDFGSFYAVLDQSRDDLLDWMMTEDELNMADPNRSETGEPRALAARRLSSYTSTLGRVQYEIWPYWTDESATRRYPYFYSKRPELYSYSDYLEGVFRHRHDVYVLLALREAAEWPGPDPTKPHPFFSLKLSERKEERLAELLLQCEREDEEIYMTWLETVPWHNRRPISGRDYRSHE